MEVNLPPLPTQRRIAAILSAYDNLIENNARRIAILEEMARNLYREWFVEFRFPGHELGVLRETAIGSVPERWEVIPLESVCTRITDGSHWSPKTTDTGYPMASVKDMHNWGLDLDSCRRISEEDYHKLVRNDCRPLRNDILIAKDGSYLKHIFVIDSEQDVVVLSSIAILRPNEKILPNLLSLHLKQPEVLGRMKGYVSGVAIPRIVLKDFRKFLVSVPPRALQVQLNGLIEPMVRECFILTAKNRNLRRQRDLLLPKLVSGELDVSELEIAGMA